MSERILKKIKLKIYNVNSFIYPKYSIINNIKIADLNIFSKPIAKNKILVYGNYDIILSYKNIIHNNHSTKDLVKYKKVSFRKILYYDIYKFSLIKDLKADIELLSKPLPIYSLRKFHCYLFGDCNLCQISLFLSISINLYKSEPSTEFKNRNSNTSENILTKSNDLNNNNLLLLPDNKLLIEDNTTSKNTISVPVVEELSDFNSINDDIYISKQHPSIRPYRNRLYSHNNHSKISKKKLIEGDVILGMGYSEILLEKTITLSDPIKPIWKITKVIATAEATKIDIRSEKAFVDGFTYIDINYKTYFSSENDNIKGSIQYIHLSIPFSLCIDLVSDNNDKIKDSDNCNVSSIYVSEVHELTKPAKIDNKTIYNEFTGQFIIQVTVLVTRNLEFYI